MTQNSSLDPTTRYVKNHIDKEVWKKARSLAILRGETITKWIESAMEEKIKKDSK